MVGRGRDSPRSSDRIRKAPGCHYNWHRYYDPSLGRYISADPIGRAGGINVYTYASNSPTEYIDPFGLFRFGKRPLKDWGPAAAFATRDPILNYANLQASHEQGFFEDGSGENIGFGPAGIRSEKNPETLGYEYDDAHYDDALMRRALENTFDGGPYSHFGNNCQDWADRLRAEYDRLLNKTGGQSVAPTMTPAPPEMSFGI